MFQPKTSTSANSTDALHDGKVAQAAEVAQRQELNPSTSSTRIGKAYHAIPLEEAEVGLQRPKDGWWKRAVKFAFLASILVLSCVMLTMTLKSNLSERSEPARKLAARDALVESMDQLSDKVESGELFEKIDGEHAVGEKLPEVLERIGIPGDMVYVDLGKARGVGGKAGVDKPSNKDGLASGPKQPARKAGPPGIKPSAAPVSEGASIYPIVTGKTHIYHIAAEEVEWDYRPAGPLESGMGDIWLTNNGESTIGRVYRKARYVEYTDATFTISKSHSPEWAHLGLVGPVLRAAVGDVIEVVFTNKCQYPYTMHPHGVFYDLTSEGADFPGWKEKIHAVLPGHSRTYRWYVPERAGPEANGPSSIAWLYYSHANAAADTNAGLVGPIIISKEGAGRPADVDKEFVLYVSVTDESKSHYLEKNVATYLPNADFETLVTEGPRHEEFEEGNLKHGMNFRLFDDLASELSANIGEKVRIYLLALGTEVDMHTIHWHGMTGTSNGEREDVLNLLPSTYKYADIVPDVAGDWPLHCHVNDHIMAGMVTHMHVEGETVLPSVANTHVYYIAAEEMEWDYRPSGPLSSGHGDIWLVNDESQGQIGSVYLKARYVEYTDATFSTRKLIASEWAHLGLLGPVLRASVGDKLEVVFKNKANHPYTMHPHGVFYELASEGADFPALDTAIGNRAPVQPGDTKTYHWFVPERAGPAENDPSSIVWLYHSHANEVADTSAGLVGAIVITRRGTEVSSSGKPLDVDREFVLFFSVTDESASENYLEHNVQTYLPSHQVSDLLDEANPLHATFEEANLRHAVNFRMFDDLAAELTMNVGERVRFYIMSLGTEVDMHTIHWHGMTGVSSHHRKDVLELMPGSFSSIDMTPDVPGIWPLHCHVNDHLAAGMLTHVRVNGATVLPTAKKVVEYFIAAEEVDWNYCPKVPVDGTADVWCVRDVDAVRIGPVYRKARYVEYTDATFTVKKDRGVEWEHLGLVGPVLRAQVGDMIQVTFKNLANFPYTMHPHGVFYELPSEGADFPGLDTPMAQERVLSPVQPGATKIYKWFVPERAGPSTKDVSSMVWMYHSHAAEAIDTNAGLVGAIIVTGAGVELAADGSGRPADVDREFVLYLSVVNEMMSEHYIAENVREHLGVDNGHAFLEENEGNEDFEEGNLMHAMNFYLFDNLPGLNCVVGEKVRVYITSLGTEVDLHTLHFHGMTGVLNGEHKDVVDLLPSSMFSIDIVPDIAGSWAVHCHVNDHIEAGMGAHMVVAPVATAARVSAKIWPAQGGGK
eukprot:g76860.t1